MNTPFPGGFYRDIVQELCVHFNPGESGSEDEFYSYLDACYKADSQALAAAGIDSEAPRSVSDVKNGVFVFAVGLFTFGRLDVVEDIIKRMPSSGQVRGLEYVINVLLPLPDNLDPIMQPDTFHRWLTRNAERLIWNKNKGLFEWKNTG